MARSRFAWSHTQKFYLVLSRGIHRIEMHELAAYLQFMGCWKEKKNNGNFNDTLFNVVSEVSRNAGKDTTEEPS